MYKALLPEAKSLLDKIELTGGDRERASELVEEMRQLYEKRGEATTFPQWGTVVVKLHTRVAN